MSKQNNAQTVKYLINHGANVNAKTGQGQTALTYASRDGFLETVEHLIANGTNVNSTTRFGFTALMVSFKIRIQLKLYILPVKTIFE